MCIKKSFYQFMLVTFSVSIFTAHAGGINASDINTQEQMRQQERQQLLRQQQEIKPDVRDEMDALKQTPLKASIEIPDNETPCFTINNIKLIGDDASKFQFALDEVLSKNIPSANETEAKPILGRCLGVQGINAVMNRVQNVIIAKGYVTTRVLAAPQDLKAGLLQLTVIPGHVGAIRFTPDSSKRISMGNAAPINAGDILNLRDIEQSLENFKRVPTADANIQIEPSSENKPGQSDVVIKYQQRFPLRISVGVDDSGLNSTGKYLGNTTLSGNNLLSLSDMFYVNYNHDLGGGDSGKRGTKGYTAHYSIPWDYWLLSATTSSNDYHQQVAGALQNYIYSGTSQNAEVKLNRLIYRNSINKTNLSLRGFLRKSFNYIDDTEIEVQRRRTAGWELGFNQSWYLGAAILDYNLAYRRGTGAEDALKAPEEGFGEGTSHMKMLLGDLNLSVPFSVNAPWGKQALQYTANLRGQTNYTPLTPQDRFSIGSRFTVRGFDGQQTLIADHGWLIRNELIAPIASSGQSVYWGLDYGEVGGQSSKYLIGKYLAGTVIGLRGGVGSQRFGNLSYDVFVGKPINKPQGFATHESVAGFSLNYSY
jgi:hemolysin activation/secretion protein